MSEPMRQEKLLQPLNLAACSPIKSREAHNSHTKLSNHILKYIYTHLMFMEEKARESVNV
jgi:hypothetical protein